MFKLSSLLAAQAWFAMLTSNYPVNEAPSGIGVIKNSGAVNELALMTVSGSHPGIMDLRGAA